MTIATSFEQVTNNSPDGAQMGKGTAEKVAFYGSTPVIQPSSANQAAASVTAANPSAPAALSVSSATGVITASVPAITYSSNTPTPSDTQTIADGTVPTVAELGQFTADQEDLNLEIKADLDAHKTAIDAVIADNVASRAEVITYEVAISKLIIDVTSAQTLSNQLRSELVTLGLIKGS